MSRFSGKTIVVSGGASGIGEAIVRSFVREGAATVFLDTNRKLGEALAAEMSKAGQCRFVLGDVSQEADCSKVITLAEEAFGPVSVLVNNAAIFVYKSIDAKLDDWLSILRVNLIGTSMLSKFAVESMRRTSHGAIVNMGSISAFIAQAGTMTYNATKAAIVEMTRCMALDLSKDGIRVNSVCPGYTVTEAFHDYVSKSGRKAGDIVAELESQTILKRMATPQEIANCVLFLCSSEASYVTGTALMADGGLTCL